MAGTFFTVTVLGNETLEGFYQESENAGKKVNVHEIL